MNDTPQTRTYASLRVGEEASLERTLTPEVVAAFAGLSGDHNPLHTDAAYARHAGFAGQVVHGMLFGAFVSSLVGMSLPGTHALLLTESLEFKKPAYVGDTVVIRATLTHLSDATQSVELSLRVMRAGETLAEGVARVKVLA